MWEGMIDIRSNMLHYFVLGIPHVALFNFSPQDYRELSLRQGELIYVTFVDTGGWVKAVNESGIQGWAPQNFVVQIDPEQYAATKKVVEVMKIAIMTLFLLVVCNRTLPIGWYQR